MRAYGREVSRHPMSPGDEWAREHRGELEQLRPPPVEDLAPLPPAELRPDGRAVIWRPHPQWSARFLELREGWEARHGVDGERPATVVRPSLPEVVEAAIAAWATARNPPD